MEVLKKFPVIEQEYKDLKVMGWSSGLESSLDAETGAPTCGYKGHEAQHSARSRLCSETLGWKAWRPLCRKSM